MQFVLQIYWFLEKTIPEEKNMTHKITIIIVLLILSFTLSARPARHGIISLEQPDGTVFDARIRGDEFYRLTTTAEGCAIVQDKEGWWCYAIFDEEGKRSSSGWIVGRDTPSSVISGSRRIPFSILGASAAGKRSSAPVEERTFIEKFGPMTKNGTSSVKHGIVILAQFSDVKLTHGRQEFVNLLTKKGYSDNGATGSAKEYFDYQFAGKVEFKFDVSNIVTLPGKRADYGENNSNGEDKAAAQMVADACRAVDGEIDFSLYDDDRDGEVDNVFIFFAGGDEAEGAGEDCIWSHAWYLSEGAGIHIVLDGKRINRYACTSELARRYYSSTNFNETLTGIGTFCHEYSHTLGLPDFYDTDYEGSGGKSAGLWIWTSLMDGGNQNNNSNTPPNFNALERDILGLSEPEVIEVNGSYNLGPINLEGRSYRINTDDDNEYFLIEYRSGEGWDKYAGGSGLLIYHIDMSRRNAGWSDLYQTNLTARQRWDMNELNARPDHQCADLLEADGRADGFDLEEDPTFLSLLSQPRGVFFPYQDIDAIPSERLCQWSGNASGVSLKSIIRSGDGISFTVTGLGGRPAPPEVTEISAEAFPESAIIQFESAYHFEGDAVVEWGRTGQSTETTRVKAYESGRYAVILNGLEPGNKTYTVKIAFEDEGVSGEPSSISFMTKRKPSVDWPYIYTSSSYLNSDGTYPPGAQLPLMAGNAGDVAEIRWSFNGKAIERQGNGYYTVTESGTLMAEFIRNDGSEERIIKEIIIRKEENDD